jgi:sulfide:quinone oxidoreductase
MSGRRIVVIGGGFGGVAAARTARSLLGSEHTVTLVDRLRRTYMCGSFPLLIVGEREAAKVSRSLGRLANRGIRFVQAEVDAIDVESRTVATTAGVLDFDYLVIGLGASYDWDAVPGSETAHSFYDLDNARRLRRKLRSFRTGRMVVAVSSLPYKCPPAPFEAAMVMDWAFRQRGVRRDIEIHLHTPEPVPLPVAGPEAGARLGKDLERRGIELHTDSAVTEVSRDGRQAGFSDGTSMDADLVVTVPTHRAAEVVASAGLTGESGWVRVSPETLETPEADVYAVGDVNAVPMATGRPIPKAGVFASSEGEVVGRNIAAAINGDEPVRFSGVGHCYISYSGTQAGMVRGEFLAEDKPRVELSRPSARGARSKERFERDWRRFRI